MLSNLSSAVKRFSQRHSLALWMLIIFSAAVVLRLGAIKQYVTPDEPAWVMRSLDFSLALSRGDWAATAQIGHPGVTTMWLGSLGIALKRWADPAASSQAIEWLSHLTTLAPENAEAFKRLGVFLTFARLPVILVNVLGLVGIFWLLQCLFDRRLALFAAFLIALDPFTAGLGGLLHVDGLLATFATLSVLAVLNAIHRSSQGREIKNAGWFALAGFFAALAFLSKSPALFLTPFTFVVVAGSLILKKISFRAALIGFLTFVICHLAFVVLLYPALWVDPIGTLQGILGLAAFLSANAVRPTFFDGQYVLNHGLEFYPTALIYRLTPIEVIGLALALIFMVRRLWLRRSNARSTGSNFVSIVWLLLGAILFLGFITPVAKKYDRYMLPAFDWLILVAAWGFDRLAMMLSARQRARSIARLATPILLIGVLG